MKIAVIGTGFVGVVSAAVYASFGHQVVGLDIDEQKVASLKKGQVPFYEPGLEKLLLSGQKKGLLTFTTDYQAAIKDSQLVIIAVGTPSQANNQADLRFVFSAAEALAPHLSANTIVAVKSTVPPGTLTKVQEIITPLTKSQYYLASLPEFLREGSAVEDTLHPDRIIVGADDPKVFKILTGLFQPLAAPILEMSPASAQMAKYTANAYLATRITFINQIADLCEHNGADIQEVISGIGYDKRIGHHYWYPGLGYGGSCFPKDVKELAAYSLTVNEPGNLLIRINELNNQRIPDLIRKYSDQVNGFANKKVAVLGLSFKPDTDDTREAPATKVVPLLLAAGAEVFAYDPMAKWEPQGKSLNYQQVDSILTATKDADVIFVLIEWPEIIEFDYRQIKTNKPQTIIDPRNQLIDRQITKLGFDYLRVGH